MNALKTVVTASSVLLLISCGAKSVLGVDSPSEQIEPVPPDYFGGFTLTAARENMKSLLTQFDRYPERTATETPSGEPEKGYDTLSILKQIHPWLTLGNGLEVYSIHNSEFYRVKRMPRNVAAELKQSAFLAEDKTGFGLLHTDLWENVQLMQDQNFKFGFTKSGPADDVSGIYYDGVGFIGMSTFANQGTIRHELRHNKQWSELHRIENKLGKYTPKALPENCIGDARQFFGELDATTVQLESWVGTLERVDVSPTEHKGIKANYEDPVTFPHLTNFISNLGYPSSVFKKLKDSGNCPEQFVAPIKTIVASLHEFEETAKNSRDRLIQMRQSHLDLQKKRTTDCVEPQSRNCKELDAEINKLPALSKVIKSDFEAKLSEEIKNRPALLNPKLGALPEPLRRDLCSTALGFSLLTSCKEFFE